ncbi:BlaI/MecI/CopY family transcriptional regulator [Rubrivirga sp. S365]|uniref:BlaI/MecI/CopY family transcriptional regulator n=1 Tax=Rubrivirga litoralis TaxID=3075598 RepID=A0ABU3BU35_9BACT|nr:MULTISPECIES: BlaI/MecI/CopY family transcriptional regulator [unclassified Rubrivirga]MDT0632801.1 BlaI/MecI/CopY family transcriptional regulator [Rubrivirga sp. F394]MDT7857492.1 BlaI/MecI/CopY family transcriptional regulator [Rubrivirga sp. S365]
MRNPLTPLGGTEMEVLREVWALGRATARDVHDRISARRRLAYTTVMTVMKNLADKGYLQYEPEGTAYVYSAARPPEEVQGTVLSGILDKVFGGSARDLVQTLVDQGSLSEADRADLRRIVDRLEDDPAPPSDA